MSAEAVARIHQWLANLTPVSHGRISAQVNRSRDFLGIPLFPAVFGAIDRRQPFASAALLLKSLDYKDSERFLAPEYFFNEMSASGIPPAEVSRLLLARSGHGGARILTMDRNELQAFRTRRMRCEFRHVQALLAIGERTVPEAV